MKVVFLFILSTILISCTPKSELLSKTNCASTLPKNTKIASDFNKNFNISIPNNWKTNLFYNNTESSIYFADTTKQLNETYIIKASFKYGEIKNIETIKHNTDSILKHNNFSKINDFSFSFNQLPAYAYTTKYLNNNRDVTIFQMYAMVNNASYLTASVEAYGSANIDKRLCEGISIINSIKISH